MLKREGVQYLFGIPGGGGTINLLDASQYAAQFDAIREL
jgi:thiamine pyrophosphate-dependent acetolactate synthase large subunit-like protein